MAQWLKDYAPILATLGALLGVIVTVGGASRTYRQGLIEKRRDHQRELLGDLIANVQQWCGLLDVVYPAMTKMSTNDMMEFADTDTGRRQGQLAQALQVTLIKCLCEISDSRIHPVLLQLEDQRRTLTDGDEVAPMFNPRMGDKERLDALLVMLGRIRGIKNTSDNILVEAIKALPVEFEDTTFQRRFRRWLAESMFVT
ncbi:hypothetical protein [Mycobacterium sp. C31M]